MSEKKNNHKNEWNLYIWNVISSPNFHKFNVYYERYSNFYILSKILAIDIVSQNGFHSIQNHEFWCKILKIGSRDSGVT